MSASTTQRRHGRAATGAESSPRNIHTGSLPWNLRMLSQEAGWESVARADDPVNLNWGTWPPHRAWP